PENFPEIVAEATLAPGPSPPEPLAARTRPLGELACGLLRRLDAIGATVTAETGKPLRASPATEPPVSVEAGRRLAGNVEDPRGRARGVSKVLFTGSVEVGRAVGIACAERLCPVTLELGGKDPMVVLDDADLERAVSGALWGAFFNCGQVCSGVERIYVDRSVYEEFCDGLAERARRLRLGAGEDQEAEVGPLISAEQRERVEDLVADAREHGAEALAGGRRPPEPTLPGWFYEPTVLAGGSREARIE